MKWALVFLAGLSTPAVVLANDLPPDDLVAIALDNAPVVNAAHARVSAAQAEAQALRRGPHEVTAQSSLSRRRVDHEGDFVEYDASLTRAFRLPGKASLDRRAGALGVEVAVNRMQDARHQAALSLATLWYDWLLASDLHRNALKLIENQRRLVVSTQRRVQLRDAAELELQQVQSSLSLTLSQAEDAAALRDRARALLSTQFPDLTLPVEAPSLAAPAIPADNLHELQEAIVIHSHEIAAASGLAERQDVIAQRTRADRFADPSFGLRVFSERGGEERGAGLIASLPLGGGYRRALADQASAEAQAAQAERTAVEREIVSNAAADIAEFRARHSAWMAANTAVERAQSSATLAARGQQLGAIDLADLLYAERQANEARAQEIQARATAARLLVKLRIDAHHLWIS